MVPIFLLSNILSQKCAAKALRFSMFGFLVFPYVYSGFSVPVAAPECLHSCSCTFAQALNYSHPDAPHSASISVNSFQSQSLFAFSTTASLDIDPTPLLLLPLFAVSLVTGLLIFFNCIEVSFISKTFEEPVLHFIG